MVCAGAYTIFALLFYEGLVDTCKVLSNWPPAIFGRFFSLATPESLLAFFGVLAVCFRMRSNKKTPTNGASLVERVGFASSPNGETHEQVE